MTMIYLWRRDFSPWSRYCPIDRMCGMRVCEWTRRELTLDIRFMSGDYDPGHSGRNREKGSKAEANGRDKSWREKEGGGQGEWSKGHEMKWGVWSPQDRWGLTGGVSDLMYSQWKNGHHQLHWVFITAAHNGKGDSSSLSSIYLFVTPPSPFSVCRPWIFLPFFPQILWEAHRDLT